MFNASIFALLMILTMVPHLSTQSRRQQPSSGSGKARRVCAGPRRKSHE